MQQVWEGDPSNFPWEQEGLNHIKNRLDELPIPYYARQCFSFTAPNGAVREGDLLVAVPAGAADAPLFEEATLGHRICESKTFLAHIEGVRRMPDRASVAAVIDAAQAAGGVLASAQVGRIADKPAVSVDGYVSQLQRALNIDGT